MVCWDLDASPMSFLINDSFYWMSRTYWNGFILSNEPYVQDTIQISLTLKRKKKVIKCASLVT